MTDPTVKTDVPDALFDADLSLPLGREGWIDRFDWLIVDGHPVHVPAIWNWTCPECGATGVLLEDPFDLFTLPHGAQHANGPYGEIVPVAVDVVRDLL